MNHLKLYEFFINDRQTLNNKIPKTDDYIVIISIEEYYVSTEIDNFLKSHVGKVIKMINAETCRIKYDEKCSENDLTADISDDFSYYVRLPKIEYELFNNKNDAEEFLATIKYNL